MNITAGEFAALDETQRAVLTYELLANVDKNLTTVNESMATIKKCIDDGKLTDNDNENAIKRAQATGEEGIKIGSLANRRIDRILWVVLVAVIGALGGLVLGVLSLLIQKGLKI